MGNKYKCKYCDKQYNHCSSKNRHQVKHVSKDYQVYRPFKCQNCNKRFTQKMNLKRHQRETCKRDRSILNRSDMLNSDETNSDTFIDQDIVQKPLSLKQQNFYRERTNKNFELQPIQKFNVDEFRQIKDCNQSMTQSDTSFKKKKIQKTQKKQFKNFSDFFILSNQQINIDLVSTLSLIFIYQKV